MTAPTPLEVMGSHLETINTLSTALAAERERADRAEARIAEAWDEGYIAVPAEPEDRETFVEDAPNPYRSEASR